MENDVSVRLLLLEQENTLLSIASVTALLLSKRERKRRHRWWIHPIIERRSEFGVYHHLVRELELDGELFQQYFRLTRVQFAEVLEFVEEEITKHTNGLGIPALVTS